MTTRPESVQAAFEVFAGKDDTGPHATAMFKYIESLEAALSTDKEKTAFNRGYVVACCNIAHLHDEPPIAHDVLRELGVTKAEVENMDLCEYDLEALQKIEQARGAVCELYKTPAAKLDKADDPAA